MPAITLYDSSFGYLIKVCTSLVHILKKASESPDAASFPEARLVADMNPLTFQVQTIARMCMRLSAAVAGVEVTLTEGNETTMADLIATTEKALAHLKSIDPSTVNGKEETPAPLVLPFAGTWDWDAATMASGFIVPNSFFHLQTAYAILRLKGVDLGKRDYMAAFAGPPSQPPTEQFPKST